MNTSLVYKLLAGLAVLAVTVIAGIVSFAHLQTLALAHGYTADTARLLPLSVDGLIVASSLALMAGAKPWLSRSALILGVSATLFGNVVQGAQYGPVGALLSAWPAISFILASEVFLGMIRRPAVEPGTVQTVAEPALDETEAGTLAPVSAGPEEVCQDVQPEPATVLEADEPGTPTAPDLPEIPQAPADNEAAAQLAMRASVLGGNPMSARKLGDKFKLSRSVAANVRRSVLAEFEDGAEDATASEPDGSVVDTSPGPELVGAEGVS